MTAGVYIHADSPLHRARPGAKLLALIVLSTLIVTVGDVAVLAVGLAATLALFPVARLAPGLAWRQLRPVLPVIVLLVVVQAISVDPASAAAVALRLSTLILLASLVSTTTRASDMVDTISRAVRPLAYLGISPTKIGLTISLALRFIPLIAEQLEEVREAQKARGLERSFRALLIPLMVRTLKMATEIGDAIEARSFAPDDAKSIGDLNPWRRKRDK